MNTRNLALVALIVALTIVLNLSPLKIPAPYAPYLIYQFWEVPIVAAFLLFGTGVGVFVSVLNTLALLVLFPGALPTGPFYNLAAVLSMLLGIGIVKVLLKRKPIKEPTTVTLYTAAGITLRAAIMTLANWTLLRYPPPIGYAMPEEVIIAALPLIALFNLTLALYTVPLGYSLVKAVRASIKTLR